MLNWLKKKELNKIGELEDKILDLEETLDNAKKFSIHLQEMLKLRTLIKCRNKKCDENIDGRCIQTITVIREDGTCEDFGECITFENGDFKNGN